MRTLCFLKRTKDGVMRVAYPRLVNVTGIMHLVKLEAQFFGEEALEKVSE